MASLDSVRQKISWAEVHLKSLEIEVGRYFRKNPAKMVMQPDLQSDDTARRLEVKIPVSPEICFLIGDFLQTLRSSLDYLVHQNL